MTRRPDWIPPRAEFPASVRKAVALRSAGMCESPSCNNPGAAFDHIVPEAIGGPCTEDNCQMLCAPCHTRKSALDAKMIAKADRAGLRSGQAKRRKAAQERGTHKAIKSRGLQKGLRKKMNGTVEKVR